MKERVSELEEISIETSQIKFEEKKNKNNSKRMEYPRTGGNYKRCNRCLMGIPEGEQRGK